MSNRDRNRNRDLTRVNERIRCPRVRVIVASDGRQLGVLPTYEALRQAKELGLDLVEIAPNADPPVCKIIDYGKYKYEKAKQAKDHKHKSSKLKEVKFRVAIGDHDYNIKLSHMEDFLEDGNKVRVQLMFRNRQIAHPEIGFDLMKRVQQDIAGMGHADAAPRMAGRTISMQISPHPAAQRVRKFKKASKEQIAAMHEKDSEHEAEHAAEQAELGVAPEVTEAPVS